MWVLTIVQKYYKFPKKHSLSKLIKFLQKPRTNNLDLQTFSISGGIIFSGGFHGI